MYRFYAVGKIILFYTKLFMRLLLFLSRVALICNVFFIVCLLKRHTHVIPFDVSGFVIIVGWILSLIFNVVVNGVQLGMLVTKRNVEVPVWLRLINLAVFLFQIVYFPLI